MLQTEKKMLAAPRVQIKLSQISKRDGRLLKRIGQLGKRDRQLGKRGGWLKISNRKFAKCHICGRSANLTSYSANLRICDLRNLFADRPPLQKIKHYQHISAKIPTQENFKLI